MAERENYELVQKGMDILLPWLSAFVCGELRRVYKDQWWEQVREALTDSDNHQLDIPISGEPLELQDSLDMANCLRLIQRRWKYVFSQKMSLSHRNWASELMGVRNTVAHQGAGDLSQSYAERALDTMALLCESIDAEATEEIRALYRKVRYGSEAGTKGVQENALSSEELRAKKKEKIAAVLRTNLEGNLPSWRDVMEPHPDVAEGRYKAAEFAADLSQVAKGEGAYEYRDPVEFFNRTYVTDGMKKLLVQSLERVTGRGGEPVIQLKTAFGGGKTHSMLALYHLLRGKTTAEAIPVVKPILEEVGITELPKANVAVLVGTALNPAKWSNPATLPGYRVSTIWGEMAFQEENSHTGETPTIPQSEESGQPQAPATPKNTHFFLSATLDNTRVIRDVDTYVKEVIQHLQEIDGAKVEIRLEVQVDAPGGIQDSTVRTVSENCRVLKADDFGFDK